MSTSPLMRPTDAAHMLQVSVRHVYTMVAHGELRSTSVGKRSVRVYRDQIEAIVARGAAHAVAQ
jgi:excisionase family DNA binding protein